MALTPDGILLSYIKSFGPLSGGLVLTALRSYWLPIAYQHHGSKKDKDLKKMAQAAILELEGQIKYLRTMFSIE